MQPRCLSLAALGLAATFPFAAPALAQGDDDFISGYASAILAREFELSNALVRVEDGAVAVEVPIIDDREIPRIITALESVPGVTAVTIKEADSAADAPPVIAVTPVAEDKPSVTRVPSPGGQSTVAVNVDEPRILARSTLFDPLLADRRWPHFSAAYQYNSDYEDVEHAGAVSFGETFSLYRAPAPFGGNWELGFQAGVFAVFDLDSESADLINADYWVGIPVAYRRGNFSAISRIYHQSSHLGDEYLLRDRSNGDDRVNLSYEAIDAILSYDIGQSWRVYGGGGYLIHREPEELEPWLTQVGAEWRSSMLYYDSLRPIAAVDVQFREENDWNPDVALRAGVQLENPRVASQTIQLTLEYYDGRNPNGQFYDRDLEYFGLGLHVYFD
ncbi:MAG TPA: DUF1207 domain-containing protein [Alphaproteobacteria bacterium]|nr:DUF1207 domain-containing protein [Alphaproteobacteria bacterium]